jgi:hypothetical protein
MKNRVVRTSRPAGASASLRSSLLVMAPISLSIHHQIGKPAHGNRNGKDRSATPALWEIPLCGGMEALDDDE